MARNECVTTDTLEFPQFEQDRVFFGAQVPMCYEAVVEFMEHYGRHPDARVHVIGKSLGGRNIYRLEITRSAIPEASIASFVGEPSVDDDTAKITDRRGARDLPPLCELRRAGKVHSSLPPLGVSRQPAAQRRAPRQVADDRDDRLALERRGRGLPQA